MILSKNRIIRPLHKIPKLHKDATLMSFENQWHIKKSYNEIIGLFEIDHFSINIVSKKGEMSIISYNPSIIYEIYRDGSYLYNGSISPTYYENLDIYSWDQCYDRRFYRQVKNNLEVKNGISQGIVLVQRKNGFHVLFSFASRRINSNLLDLIIDNNQVFLKMGFHCLERIKSIYSEYHACNDIFSVRYLDTNLCMHNNLRIIK